MSNFNSIINIENIRQTDMFAYITLRIISPEESAIHCGYKFYIKNLYTNTISPADNNTYWIDRYSDSINSDSISVGNVNINRNKKIVLTINLLNGKLSNGSMLSRIKILFKEYRGSAVYNNTAWSSEDINLTSPKIIPPTIKCTFVGSIDGSVSQVVKYKYDYSVGFSDENISQFYLRPELIVYNSNGVSVSEVVTASANNTFVLSKIYDGVLKFKINLKYITGEIAETFSFNKPVGSNFIAYKMDNFSAQRIRNIYRLNVSGNTITGTKINNIDKKS